MTDHAAVRDLIPAVALGAATDQERAEVERHVATCHDCRAELDGLRGAASQLALEVPQVDPPPALKGRIMGAVRADAAAARPRPARRRVLWPALAGAMAVLVAGLLAWNITLQRDEGGSRTVAITGTPAAPTATGVLELRDDGTAVMRVSGLPEPPPGRGFELWTIRDGVPRSEGFAARTAGGEVVVATADLAGAQVLAITEEARTNTAAPTGDPLVAVDVPA